MRWWTIGSVLASMLDTFVRRPLSVIFVLGVLPAAWLIPASILHSKLVPEDAVFGPGRSLEEIALSWLFSAWGCVWYAGEISAAVDLARGKAVQWRAFVSGLRKAPALFLVGLIMFSPLELLGALPLAPEGTAAVIATIAACGLTLVLLARTACWPLLVVASSHSLWAGLRASWKATRGHALKLIALGVVLLMMALPLFVLEGTLLGEDFYATIGLVSALYLLALGQLHLLFGEALTDGRSVVTSVKVLGASAPVDSSELAVERARESIPERSNFHLAVRGKQSPAQIAEMFRAAGWTTRASAWNEFEVRSAVAELVIEAVPVVVHGSLSDPEKTVDFVLAPLIENRVDGFCECYAADRTLLFKRDFAPRT